MSKTFKDKDLYKINKFFKVANEVSAKLTTVRLDFEPTKKEVKALTGLELQGTERTEFKRLYLKHEHRHSAAHRHSAIRTRKRCLRHKKHSEAAKVKKLITNILNDVREEEKT